MRRLIIIAVVMLLAFTSLVFAEDISITSTVDKTEVELGDTIDLTVIIKKPMENQPMSQTFGNGGFSFSFNSSSFNSMGGIDFNIENIPNFEIVGRNQSSKTQMFNGVGNTIKQIVLTLAPLKDGNLVIPAFSMKDKDGKEHTSNPITINVKKVADEPDEEEEEKASTPVSGSNSENITNQNTIKDPESKKENDIFNFLLIVGIVLIVILIGFILFINYLGNKANKSNNDINKVDDAIIVKEEPRKEEKPVAKEEVEEVVFSSIAASLKVQYKEISNEFYRKYFELFKKACCYRNKSLSQDMTYDELLNKCSELAGTQNITQATSRLAFDIETVMYANSMPKRQLINIETDIKEVLNSL